MQQRGVGETNRQRWRGKAMHAGCGVGCLVELTECSFLRSTRLWSKWQPMCQQTGRRACRQASGRTGKRAGSQLNIANPARPMQWRQGWRKAPAHMHRAAHCRERPSSFARLQGDVPCLLHRRQRPACLLACLSLRSPVAGGCAHQPAGALHPCAPQVWKQQLPACRAVGAARPRSNGGRHTYTAGR